MSHLSSMATLVPVLEQLSQTILSVAAELKDAQEGVEVAPQKAKKKVTEPVKTEEGTTKEESSLASESVTIGQIRTVLAEKSQAGLTAKVKELLNSFGAEKLSAVKQEDYNMLYEAAKALS